MNTLYKLISENLFKTGFEQRCMFNISAEVDPDTLERSVVITIIKVDHETKGIVECKKTLRPEFTEQELLDMINEAITRIDNTIALLKLRSNYENN